MPQTHPIHDVHDLTDPARHLLFNMTLEEATQRVASGDPDAIAGIEGHFAITARSGHIVRMARSLQLPLRYFIVKMAAGPALLVADRIDAIRDWLDAHGYGDQFHPTYTRMVPAHHLLEIALVGCPDPNPTTQRFFAPARNVLPADLDEIGRRYVGALSVGVHHWLEQLDDDAPVGICFSGGIDSGAVLLVTYHAMLARGDDLGRLKAFTLCVDGSGSDLAQARAFLHSADLELLLEPIEVSADAIDLQDAVALIEDYKPLDIQSGAMTMALCRGIRQRYPHWKHLVDGDGGDENLKDYPIEANPELTIRSVLSNSMLYHEGWGVDAIKHSLTFSGGLSRGVTRGYAPTSQMGFSCFSPFMLRDVIAIAEGIPFTELTDWDHQKLYDLKGKIVSRGVEAITGTHMPVFEKRRFQHGAASISTLAEHLPDDETTYRQAFHAVLGT